MPSQDSDKKVDSHNFLDSGKNPVLNIVTDCQGKKQDPLNVLDDVICISLIYEYHIFKITKNLHYLKK